MVSFGTKATREDIERSAQSESAQVDSSKRIWGFRDGATVVRFLEELNQNEWTSYWEHYDQGMKKYVPCPGREDCPLCKAGGKASKKYLVNALVVRADDSKTKAGYVNLFKIPVSIIESLTRRADKAGGTITDRDYEIFRSGKGTDTSYDVETDERYHVDIAAYADKMVDHEEALQAAWLAAFPEGAPQVQEEAPAPRTRARKPEPEEPKESEFARAKRGEIDPPTEPQSQSASADAEGDDEDSDLISEDAVRAMNAEELLDLYERAGIKPPADHGNDATHLADYLIEELGD